MNTTVCFNPLRSLRTALKAALLATLLAAVPAFAADDKTFDQESVLKDATEFFGSSTEGLAKVIEKAFKDHGRPVGYIKGEEASGALTVGLRVWRRCAHAQGRRQPQGVLARPVHRL